MPGHYSGASKGAKDVDAFNSKSTESGNVNDEHWSVGASEKLIKWMRGNNQKAVESGQTVDLLGTKRNQSLYSK